MWLTVNRVEGGGKLTGHLVNQKGEILYERLVKEGMVKCGL